MTYKVLKHKQMPEVKEQIKTAGAPKQLFDYVALCHNDITFDTMLSLLIFPGATFGMAWCVRLVKTSSTRLEVQTPTPTRSVVLVKTKNPLLVSPKMIQLTELKLKLKP